uniref:DNA-directed DNA polymerase n=1 Tax=viral metagenome TaxID=1070528 RepID=A0A6C0L854_9ZZZZ
MYIHIFDAHSEDRFVMQQLDAYADAAEYADADADVTSSREYIIQLFGATHEGTPVQIDVTGFRPFLYIRLPDCRTATDEQRWKSRIVSQLTKALKGAAFEATLVRKGLLYGYTGGKQFPFLQVSVASMSAFYTLKKALLTETQTPKMILDGQTLRIYESNIDPMLRFFHMRNVNPCGWISVDVEGDEDDIRIECEWTDIDPCAEPPVPVAPFRHVIWDIECDSFDGSFPVAKQGYRRVAKQLWAHCSSAEEVLTTLTAAFLDLMNGTTLCPVKIPPLKKPLRMVPQVPPSLLDTCVKLWIKKDSVKEREECIQTLTAALDAAFASKVGIAGDPIIQIGSVLVDGTASRHIFVLGTCDPIPGVVVHSFKDEATLLQEWVSWIVECRVDVFVGYNTNCFDEKYVWERLEELGLSEDASVQQLSRLYHEDQKRPSVKLEEKKLASSALGDNTLFIWTTPGRLRIDLLGHIRRKAQLPSYKLDSVCAVYLSGVLKGIESLSDGKWLLKTKEKKDARVGRAIQILDGLGEDLTDKLIVIGVTEDGILVTSDEDLSILGEAERWAVVKDDVSPQDIFRLQKGSSADRAIVAAYCIQDCELTYELYKKLEVFNETMSMANVCSVPVSYIFTRGQGIKIESLIFKDCRELGQLIDVLPSGSKSSEGYEGAVVLVPEPNFYTSPVGVCDFASLYPSTIISENISYDMLVWVKDIGLDGVTRVSYGSVEDEKNAPPGTRWTDIEFDILSAKEDDFRKHPVKERVGVRVCRFAQPAENGKGTLPKIVAKLLAARKAKRVEITKTADPFKKALLDAEQNAYKVTANSLYGQLGSPTFKIRLQNLAASVTAYGRKQIMYSKEAIERFYGPAANDPRCSAEIVYGDTDSIFINFNPRGTDGQLLVGREAVVATIELTEEAGKFITGTLKEPHDFEYDKVFYPFIIFSKKRYVGNKYEESPDSFKETSMGIVLKRRDNAPLLKMIYGAAIQELLLRQDVVAATRVVQEGVRALVEGKMKLSQLTITKSLRSEYKTTPPAHKILADRMAIRDPGNAPASGERVGYVYVKPPPGQRASDLQGDRVETPAFIREKGLEPDFEYYILHQLMNPLSQLFGIFVDKMPGFVAPVWEEDPTSQKEQLASDLLFKEGLAFCKQSSKKAFVGKMFGLSSLSLSLGSSVKTPSLTRSMQKGNAAGFIPMHGDPSIMAEVKKMPRQSMITSFLRESSGVSDAIAIRLAKKKKPADK